MSDPTVILLAPFDRPLAAQLAAALPDVQVGGLEALGEVVAAPWIFLDWLLPDTSGLEQCRRLRADPRAEGARIFLVLEDDDREERRRALKADADDYVRGPLSAAAVLARVRPAAAPQPVTSDGGIVHGTLRLDREAVQVRADGRPVPMSPNQFLLLSVFLEHRDRVLSRRELIGALKGGETVDERTVDVWVGRLRRALAAADIADPIRTVRQLGYVYDSF